MVADGSQIVIADDWFSSVLSSKGKPFIALNATEASKSLDAIPEMIIRLRQMGANRQTRLVALGGGVVQDVAAFIASVFMRGIEWTYIPTTLLAMADSCIGGKSSINVGPFKNLVGTFHPPSSVAIDPLLAGTLSEAQKASGLVEAAKICYCRGADTFQNYIDCAPGPQMPLDGIEQVIIASLTAKKWFIETDEFDQAERLLLNFGHTFGHAIEGASHFRVPHGLGVAVGVLCAVTLGRLLGRSYSAAQQLPVLESHLRFLLGFAPEIEPVLKSISIDEVLGCFQADKKHKTDHYNVVLVADSGSVELAKLSRDKKSAEFIRLAVASAIGTLY